MRGSSRQRRSCPGVDQQASARPAGGAAGLFARAVFVDRRVDDRHLVFVGDAVVAPAEDARAQARVVLGDRRVVDRQDAPFARHARGGRRRPSRGSGCRPSPHRRCSRGCSKRASARRRACPCRWRSRPRGRRAFRDPIFDQFEGAGVVDVAAEVAIAFAGGAARDLESRDDQRWRGALGRELDLEHPRRGHACRNPHMGGTCPGADDRQRLRDFEFAADQGVGAGGHRNRVGRVRRCSEFVLVVDQLPQRAGAGGGLAQIPVTSLVVPTV